MNQVTNRITRDQLISKQEIPTGNQEELKWAFNTISSEWKKKMVYEIYSSSDKNCILVIQTKTLVKRQRKQLLPTQIEEHLPDHQKIVQNEKILIRSFQFHQGSSQKTFSSTANSAGPSPPLATQCFVSLPL